MAVQRRPRPGSAEARERSPAVRAMVVRLYRDRGLSVSAVAEQAGFGSRFQADRDRVRRILAEEGVAERPRRRTVGIDVEPVPRVLAPWPAQAHHPVGVVADPEEGVFRRLGPAPTLVETASSAAWSAP